MAPVASESKRPSYPGSAPLPNAKPPPWIHTITGSGALGAGAGVHTFSVRQSSFSFADARIIVNCGHAAATFVASRAPDHGAAGPPGAEGPSPTGARAAGHPADERAFPAPAP